MNKHRFIERIRNRISARMHMSLICLMTIASGILVSKSFLYMGMSQPMIRYGIAVLASYAVFFLLVYWWLRIYFGHRSHRVEDSTSDSLEIASDVNLDSPYSSSRAWTGNGGRSGGGGASASWGSESDSLSSSKSDFSLGDIEEIALIIAIVALVAAVLGSAGYLIIQAPEILLEAAFEVVLATSLVKRAKKMQSEGWKFSIFKKTWWLCAIIFVLAVVFGYIIKAQCPEAISFSQYREMCWKN